MANLGVSGSGPAMANLGMSGSGPGVSRRDTEAASLDWIA
jgi:hypothetical protein